MSRPPDRYFPSYNSPSLGITFARPKPQSFTTPFSASKLHLAATSLCNICRKMFCVNVLSWIRHDVKCISTRKVRGNDRNTSTLWSSLHRRFYFDHPILYAVRKYAILICSIRIPRTKNININVSLWYFGIYLYYLLKFKFKHLRANSPSFDWNIPFHVPLGMPKITNL